MKTWNWNPFAYEMFSPSCSSTECYCRAACEWWTTGSYSFLENGNEAFVFQRGKKGTFFSKKWEKGSLTVPSHREKNNNRISMSFTSWMHLSIFLWYTKISYLVPRRWLWHGNQDNRAGSKNQQGLLLATLCPSGSMAVSMVCHNAFSGAITSFTNGSKMDIKGIEAA